MISIMGVLGFSCDLDLGMLRNHKLAKCISDVSWSSFVTKIQYKAYWYGRKIIKVDKWSPSSQFVRNADIKTARNLSKF